MRILIVDDDALIRKWLEMLLTNIPDRDIIVEKEENGLLALERIRRAPQPDLLITDIKMPQMDGLALCEHVREEFPELPVVMLSSYDEFFFVKKALQLGALDYILKTDMSIDDITSIIKKVEAERNSYVRPDSMESSRHLLNTFLANAGADEHTFLLRLDSRLIIESLIIVMLRTDRAMPESAIQSIIQQQDETVLAAFVPYHDNDYVAFMYLKDENASSQQKQAAVGRFLGCIRQQEGCSLEAWSSTLNCSEIGIYTSIQTCRSVLKFKYYYGLENFRTVPYHEVGECSPATQIPAFQRFFDVISRYQMHQAAELLEACMEAFHREYYNPADIEKYMSLMCHKLLSDIPALDVQMDQLNHTLHLLHEVISASTCGARVQALNTFINQWKVIFSSVKQQRSDIISKTLTYIDEHYFEKITLEQVASYVHLHVTYMSEYFKREMGVTFNDYVNNLRIIHSCEYLRFTTLSIGQIAERCGFADQNYFTKVFKKYMGATPSQYRTIAAGDPQWTQLN